MSTQQGSTESSEAISILRQAGALEDSLTSIEGGGAGIRAENRGWEILFWAPSGQPVPGGMTGQSSELGGGTLLTGDPDHANATALRGLMPWLQPRTVGAVTSVGVGDRLGIATVGHIAAFRDNPGIVPVLAQQSARELARTGRSFRDVVDAATFGALAAGWRDGYGADADHLKTVDDIDAGLDAGCTLFTADPGDFVVDLPPDAPQAAIEAAFAAVPWAALEDDPTTFGRRYPARLDLDSGSLELPPAALRAAAARFGPAVVQVVSMYRHLASKRAAGSFEFEVAADEIENPTTLIGHVYVATELRRLGVDWVSLAPKFVGEFEKGIDYLGDQAEFAADVELHAAIARRLGDYKLSIHSGSDKYSIYDAIARGTHDRVHLKTSGTSYLVALETIAAAEPELMRRIWRVALGAYTAARATYHVSANPAGATSPEGASAAALAGLLSDPNTREILHVTYGAVLHDDAVLGNDVRAAIWSRREHYWANLEAHIGRHLRPFSRAAARAAAKGDSR